MISCWVKLQSLKGNYGQKPLQQQKLLKIDPMLGPGSTLTSEICVILGL